MTPMQQDQQQHPAPPPRPSPSSKPKLSPRAHGALVLGLGVALEAANGAYLAMEGQFYPKLVVLGTAMVPLGVWTLITGIAYERDSAVKPPMWWTVGAVVLTLAGAGVGIFISDWLER